MHNAPRFLENIMECQEQKSPEVRSLLKHTRPHMPTSHQSLKSRMDRTDHQSEIIRRANGSNIKSEQKEEDNIPCVLTTPAAEPLISSKNAWDDLTARISLYIIHHSCTANPQSPRAASGKMQQVTTHKDTSSFDSLGK